MFVKMVLKSIRRRRKELRFVSVVTFIAVLFLTSVSVFQNIMDRYVIEANYNTYGEWVLSAVDDPYDPQVMFEEPSHPYLSREGICAVGWDILDDSSEPDGRRLGVMDEALIDIGNISLHEGRLPETADEIAMDLPSLAAMGYSYDLGQKIQVTVQDMEGQKKAKEFTLTGTLKSFADNWVSPLIYSLPGGLVTQEGMDALGGAAYTVHFYQLDRKYEDMDTAEFVQPFLTASETAGTSSSSEGGPVYTYNSSAYRNRMWGSEEMFLTVRVILVLITVAAVGYLLASYETERRRWHYQYRTIGAERSQVRQIILAEGIIGVFPYALLAQILPHPIGALICLAVSKKNGTPYFYEFHLRETLVQAAVIFGVLLAAILITWLRSGDRTLARSRPSGSCPEWSLPGAWSSL